MAPLLVHNHSLVRILFNNKAKPLSKMFLNFNSDHLLNSLLKHNQIHLVNIYQTVQMEFFPEEVNLKLLVYQTNNNKDYLIKLECKLLENEIDLLIKSFVIIVFY